MLNIAGECHPMGYVTKELAGLCWWYVMSRRVRFPLPRARANDSILSADPNYASLLERAGAHLAAVAASQRGISARNKA